MIVSVYRSFSAARCLGYIDRAKPGETALRLGSNVVRSDTQAPVKRFEGVARLRPETRKPYLHIVINPGGVHYSKKVWHRLVRRALQLFGISVRTHPYLAGLHRRTDGEHGHILTTRVGIDGGVWSGTHQFTRAIEVARVLEKEFSSPDREAPLAIHNHHTLVNINRVLMREGAAPIEAQWLLEQLTETLHERCEDLETFIRFAALRGIVLEPREHEDGNTGICMVMPTQRSHRLKLSALTGKLFSSRTLEDYYQNRTGRLADYRQRTLSPRDEDATEHDQDDSREYESCPDDCDRPGPEDSDCEGDPDTHAPADGR